MDAISKTRLTGEDFSSTGNAKWVCTGSSGKGGAFAYQSVKMWSFDYRISQRRDSIRTLVVRKQENDIGVFSQKDGRKTQAVNCENEYSESAWHAWIVSN